MSKHIIHKKEKIKSEKEQIYVKYQTNLMECKMIFQTKSAELKRQKKSLKPDEYKAKHAALKKEKTQKIAAIKKEYKESVLACMKNNTISLDNVQFDQHKAELVFQTTNKISRSFKYLALTKNQKEIFKKMVKNQDEALNRKKTSFDPKNVFEIYNFNFWYNANTQALFDINLKIKRHSVTALIGPSGCGKSTFLKCLNRMNPDDCTCTGSIYFNDGTNIFSKKLNILSLRTRVGMIFQKATPFPMSVYDNVAYGPKSHGITDKVLLDKIVRDSLQQAALWDEVKDKLLTLGTSLSGGQQRKLCIARTLALKPEVLLIDESASGLDPIATAKIENLMGELKQKYTIILVSNSMAQVQRVADYTAFFFKGRLVEYGTTKNIFINPKNQKTKDYIIGKIS